MIKLKDVKQELIKWSELLNEIFHRYDGLSYEIKFLDAIHDDIYFFNRDLKNKYSGDYLFNTHMYHVLAVGTFQEECERFDLEGDESYCNFIQRLDTKYTNWTP